jgi:hypothetical protein
MEYVHRYVSLHVHSSSEFQVCGGQLRISSFDREDVRCLCLILLTPSQYSSDGKCMSFSMLYYEDSLLQGPQLIRWSNLFLRQFCRALYHYHIVLHGVRFFLFA